MDLLSAAAGEGDVLTRPKSVPRPRCQRSACHERMVKVARKPRLASSAGMIRGLILRAYALFVTDYWLPPHVMGT